MLTIGEPAPWFFARNPNNSTLQFDTLAGSYVVLCFWGSAGLPDTRQLLTEIERHHARFDLENCSFVAVLIDPEDERHGRVRPQWPGIQYAWDFNLVVSRLYGVASANGRQYQRLTLVLDPALRTLAVFPFQGDAVTHVHMLLDFLDGLPPLASTDGFAPILMVPHVFEPEFCRALIECYQQHGGEDIGTAGDVRGRTVNVVDPNVKRRADHTLVDPSLIQGAAARLQRRLFPEIKKAFQFDAAHIERYIVGCYDSSTGGHFRKHRDHLTRATAHRRFAVTINLNAESYEGGDLRFPEFGRRSYRGPTGGAIVFSCALLHEVMRVTRGKRFAFLPFLYDDEAARILDLRLPASVSLGDPLMLRWMQRRFGEVKWKLDQGLANPQTPPAQRAILLTSLAQIYLETGQVAQAVELMQQVPPEAADFAEVLAVGALVLTVQGTNVPEAEARLRRALQQQPANALYHAWLGLVLARQGRVHEGLQIMEEVSTADLLATNPAFLDHLGDVYALAQNPAMAHAAWQKALEVFPRTADPADWRRRRIQEKLLEKVSGPFSA